MPVKLTEVAKQAGVSLATASRVLNGSARTPAPDIAERVKAAALELGYVANAQAQALARSTTGLVGLVVHDIADPYFSTIAHGVQESAREHGRQVLLASIDLSKGSELDAVNAFASYRTDAIILAASRLQAEDSTLSTALERYIANGGRVVTLGETSIPHALVLEINNHGGAKDLVNVLHDEGARNFAILAGPSDRNTARSRVAGYRAAMSDLGIEPLATVYGSFSREGGYQAALECLDLLEKTGNWKPGAPLCLLVVNDVMALGAMTAIRSRKLSVPQDVQVAGFDDIPTLRDHFPGLTTYRLPLEEIGRAAAQLALSGVEEHPAEITGQVIVRDSAGNPTRTN